MSLRPSVETVVMTAFIVAAPMFAQTSKPASEATVKTTATQSGQSAATQTTEPKPTVPSGKIRGGRYHARVLSGSSHEKLWNDSTRLAAILVDMQRDATLSADAWKVSANEANVLAARIARDASKNERSAARSAREHVGAMRDAALKGDTSGAKAHAGEALRYVCQVIDASMPSST